MWRLRLPSGIGVRNYSSSNSTISDLHSAFRDGHLQPAEVWETSLKAAKTIEPLNAFVHIFHERPPEQQQQQQQQQQNDDKDSKSLRGVPFAVKDNFCVRDSPTTCASEMLRLYRPPFSATVVERAQRAGAVVVGKTNLDEFAMGSGGLDSVFGPTRSVWRSGIPYSLRSGKGKGKVLSDVRTGGLSNDDWIVAGGSSSGSAVAVSSGVCLAALGSDTGGSVRIPGSWNGIVTLKPTYGALSRHGLIPLCNSLDVPGLMARCVDDVALVFDALKGVDPRDSTSVDRRIPSMSHNDLDLSKITVGIPKEYHCQDMSPEVIEAWSKVADLLEEGGARVVQVSLPHTADSIVCYSVLNCCEVASNMARFDGLQYGIRKEDDVSSSTDHLFAESRHAGFNYVVRGRILAGNYFLLKENAKEYFLRALKVRRLVDDDFRKVWDEDKVDLLLTPATLNVAPRFSDFGRLDNRTQTTKQDYCTQPANLSGVPAATIPVGLSSADHLPISLQVIGRRFEDHRVLELCRWLERRLDFPHLVLD